MRGFPAVHYMEHGFIMADYTTDALWFSMNGFFPCIIPYYNAYNWVLCISAKVYTFGWWMGMYGGQSPKRHRGYTNNPAAARLDLGVYKRSEQAKKKLETVRRYTTRDGRAAYVGTKNLRSTQSRAHFLCFVIYNPCS